jgi:N utilization substance protein B
MPTVVAGFLTGRARWRGMLERAELLATAVAAQAEDLDRGIAEAVDHWRLDRIGVIEQNILRLALHELSTGGVPPRVAISEAVQLARWFAGPRAPAFVNGVLDGLARRAGQL